MPPQQIHSSYQSVAFILLLCYYISITVVWDRFQSVNIFLNFFWPFVFLKDSFPTVLFHFLSIFFVNLFCGIFLSALYQQHSCSQMFFKTGVPKRFAIFTGKHLCWCLLLIKLQVRRLAILLKRDFNTGAFLWILWNFEEEPSLKNTSGGCFFLHSETSPGFHWTIWFLPSLDFCDFFLDLFDTYAFFCESVWSVFLKF